MGSPSVFHTAPPQPASNARMTCSPVLLGGADASQNGLGLLMPAKSMLRSAMGSLGACRGLGPARVHVVGGVAAVGDGVDHFLAPVHAVAAAVHLGVARDPRLRVGGDAPSR